MHTGPSLLPLPRAQQVRLFLQRQVPSEVHQVPLPHELARAVPRRQLQFRAGRYCAMKAMESLDRRFGSCQVDRAANGAPQWPEGLTGSITHTDDFASAAVALTTDVEALGIDTEPIVSSTQARDLADLVGAPDETARARAAGMSENEAFTFVFSAKESIFKCLHPITSEYMDFHDVVIENVDAHARTFAARITRTVSRRFPRQTILEGCFEVALPWIHTGILLPSSRHDSNYHHPDSGGHRTLA